MADPIPYVVKETGSSGAAPDGAIPISLFGAGGGGGGGAVDSVNGKTGEVVLDADDVGALPVSYVATYIASADGTAGAAADDGGSVRLTVASGATPVELGVLSSPDGRMALIHNGSGAPVDSSAAPNGSGIVLHADLSSALSEKVSTGDFTAYTDAATGAFTELEGAVATNTSNVASTFARANEAYELAEQKVAGLNGAVGLWIGASAELPAEADRVDGVLYAVVAAA